MKLTCRTAIISGGGSCIGRAIAKILGQNGAAIVILDIDDESIETTENEI